MILQNRIFHAYMNGILDLGLIDISGLLEWYLPIFTQM